jgi:hypothetical protein
VERIQNRRLWTVFQTELHFLKEKHGGKEVEVKYLFHGTRDTAPRLIYECEEGFDMKFSAQGMWGRANYFAVNSSYSNGYRFKNPDGNFQMFYAKVIIGNTVQVASNSSLTHPPLLPGSMIDRFDSVKGNTNGSDVYMVYANKKAYPEYLITYKA